MPLSLSQMLEFCSRYRLEHPEANDGDVRTALAEYTQMIDTKPKNGGVNSVRTE